MSSLENIPNYMPPQAEKISPLQAQSKVAHLDHVKKYATLPIIKSKATEAEKAWHNLLNVSEVKPITLGSVIIESAAELDTQSEWGHEPPPSPSTPPVIKTEQQHLVSPKILRGLKRRRK